MANEPDPPEEWRVYQSDPTPDPEPERTVPPGPPQPPAPVPYGGAQPHAQTSVVRVSAGPKLVVIMIGVIVLAVGVAAAVAIFAAVDSGIDGIGGIGGIDAKSSEDFEDFVAKLEEERGSTEVNWVGLYSDYIVVDVPYTDKPGETREVSYSWRGGGLDESTKGTSTDETFDVAQIDPAVIDGMCDPVLADADGASKDECYVFISKPSGESKAWFRASASDDFNIYYWVDYDIDGNELERGHS